MKNWMFAFVFCLGAEAFAEGENKTAFIRIARHHYRMFPTQNWGENGCLPMAQEFDQKELEPIRLKYQELPANLNARTVAVEIRTKEGSDIFRMKEGKWDSTWHPSRSRFDASIESNIRLRKAGIVATLPQFNPYEYEECILNVSYNPAIFEIKKETLPSGAHWKKKADAETYDRMDEVCDKSVVKNRLKDNIIASSSSLVPSSANRFYCDVEKVTIVKIEQQESANVKDGFKWLRKNRENKEREEKATGINTN